MYTDLNTYYWSLVPSLPKRVISGTAQTFVTSGGWYYAGQFSNLRRAGTCTSAPILRSCQCNSSESSFIVLILKQGIINGTVMPSLVEPSSDASPKLLKALIEALTIFFLVIFFFEGKGRFLMLI